MFYIYFLVSTKVRYKKVYQRIRDMREDADLKQQELADYLQCTQVCYSCYETGRRNIPVDVLIKLADYYHVSVDYLLGRTNNPEVNK